MRTVFIIVGLTFTLILANCTSHKKASVNYPDCSSTDIAKMDTCLLGMTLRQVINKLKIDTSQLHIIQEPLFTLRGISYMPNDSSRIELFVQRTSIYNKRDSLEFSKRYLFVIDKPITAVRWSKDAGATEKTVYISERK